MEMARVLTLLLFVLVPLMAESRSVKVTSPFIPAGPLVRHLVPKFSTVIAQPVTTAASHHSKSRPGGAVDELLGGSSPLYL